MKNTKFQITNHKQIPNPKSKNSKQLILLISAIVLSLSGLSACNKEPVTVYYSDDGRFSVPLGRDYNYADILVKRAVDGDTLVLEDNKRVRLIGVDTPELHESKKLYRDAQRANQDARSIQKLGLRAYEFTKKLVEGKRVSLEFDVERHDKYGRLLAYVYLKDGTFVNAEIVKQGFANLMTIPPNVKYADLFLKLYRQARNDKRGLWGG